MTRDIKPSLLGLRHIALLEDLDDEALRRLAAECSWRTHDAGQLVFTRNFADRSVHLIVGGRIRVTTFSNAGRQVTFRDIERGDYFGELSAIDGKPRSADALAIESSVLASVPPQVFRALQLREPAVAQRATAHGRSDPIAFRARHRDQHGRRGATDRGRVESPRRDVRNNPKHRCRRPRA